MKKRGQFYLVAALIIIAIILGFFIIQNTINKDVPMKIYELRDNLKDESVKVMDYGTYSEFDEEQMKNLLTGFITDYSEKYGEDINQLYFIFGNLENVTVIGYQDLNETVIQVDVGKGESPLIINKGEPSSGSYSPEGEIVKIVLEGYEYEFKLKPGENFYFIIVMKKGGEIYIETG